MDKEDISIHEAIQRNFQYEECCERLADKLEYLNDQELKEYTNEQLEQMIEDCHIAIQEYEKELARRV